ncbi:hypothetical protein [Shewanella marina]|uniref:hypothetical protein n=1 Tax=Shewanella marina TaxID=487319 RepID=UPI000470B86F|nr:hypothetical protein [Shewanella marina]
MTEGAILVKKLKPSMNRIKKFALLGAILGACFSYFVVIQSLTFSLLIFLCLTLIAIDEYYSRYKIIISPEKLKILSQIDSKRKAHIYVNGGIFREFKQLTLIGIVVVSWFYIK